MVFAPLVFDIEVDSSNRLIVFPLQRSPSSPPEGVGMSSSWSCILYFEDVFYILYFVFNIEVDSSNRLIVSPVCIKVTFITARRGGDVIIMKMYFCVLIWRNLIQQIDIFLYNPCLQFNTHPITSTYEQSLQTPS